MSHDPTNPSPDDRPRRRSHGEGSIYPIRDRSGRVRRYGAGISLGHTNGRRLRRVVTGRDQAEVQQKLDALKDLQQAFDRAAKAGVLPPNSPSLADLFWPPKGPGRPKHQLAVTEPWVQRAEEAMRLRDEGLGWKEAAARIKPKVSVDTLQRDVNRLTALSKEHRN